MDYCNAAAFILHWLDIHFHHDIQKTSIWSSSTRSVVEVGPGHMTSVTTFRSNIAGCYRTKSACWFAIHEPRLDFFESIDHEYGRNAQFVYFFLRKNGTMTRIGSVRGTLALARIAPTITEEEVFPFVFVCYDASPTPVKLWLKRAFDNIEANLASANLSNKMAWGAAYARIKNPPRIPLVNYARSK